MDGSIERTPEPHDSIDGSPCEHCEFLSSGGTPGSKNIARMVGSLGLARVMGIRVAHSVCEGDPWPEIYSESLQMRRQPSQK